MNNIILANKTKKEVYNFRGGTPIKTTTTTQTNTENLQLKQLTLSLL